MPSPPSSDDDHAKIKPGHLKQTVDAMESTQIASPASSLKNSPINNSSSSENQADSIKDMFEEAEKSVRSKKVQALADDAYRNTEVSTTKVAPASAVTGVSPTSVVIDAVFMSPVAEPSSDSSSSAGAPPFHGKRGLTTDPGDWVVVDLESEGEALAPISPMDQPQDTWLGVESQLLGGKHPQPWKAACEDSLARKMHKDTELRKRGMAGGCGLGLGLGFCFAPMEAV